MVATGLVARWSVERARIAWSLLFACGGAVALAATTVPTLPMQGGSLIAVNPLGASPGVTIFITGTGFNTTASMNVVTFTPASGSSATAIPSAIATVDATLDRRRLTVVVPQALPAGPTALSVTNTATGSISSGLSLEVLHITGVDPPTGAPGTTGLRVVLTASGNTGLIAGNTVVNLGAGLTVRQVQVLSPTQAAATVDIAASAALGARNVILRSTNQSLFLPEGFAVSTAPPPNREPEITSTPVVAATVGQAYAYQVLATDPDGDPLTYSLPQAPAGMAIGSTTGAISWTPQTGQAGSQAVTVHVSDGKGGTDTQAYAVQVDPPPAVLTGISAAPDLVRFADLEATRALTVVGQKSDGSSVDLTPASAGTTYSSSHPFVASVSADGLVTARGNGDATITAANGTFSDTVAVAVEIGVTLNALTLSPPAMTLRLAGATQALTLHGTFSDGSVRDLTSSPGTSYNSSVASVASVSAAGLVLAATNGSTQITGSHGDLTATAEVVVSIPQGQGFIRGAAFDDSRGLPLPGATVLLLSDGGGVVDPPATTLTDESGRYVLQGRGGGAVVRVQKSGFTTVDRRVEIPASGVAPALDTRLTPIDSRSNPLQSVFGGQARDTAGGATLTLPSGALPADTDLRVTPISPQGLAGRLPAGWSPVAAVDVLPATMTLSQAATLVVSNAGGAAASSEVMVAEYDRLAHHWVALPAVQVAADGRTITVPVTTGGQFVFLVADAAPFTPPAAVPGQALSGVDLVDVPDDLTADGEVLPRSAPPGNSARALGRIAVGAASPLPSGTAVQVHVSEHFELLDSTSVVPLPFTQDILVHARPRPPTGGALGAVFPITPSRSYTIQELMRGVVTLDVARVADDASGTAAGPQGALVTNTEGDQLVIPPAALASETVVRLSRILTTPSGGIPAGFELLGAFEVDLIGGSFAVPARLSIALPVGVTSTDQILLVQSFIDPAGVRRMRVAGVGRIESNRLVSDHVLGTLVFGGVTAGGQYFFLKAAEPFGFVTGVITGADGATPAPLALVTSSTAPFVDVTGAAGRYVVAARAAADASIAARHLLSADGATGLAHPAARDAVVILPLALAVAPPSVVAISPAAGAVNVPLDASITIDFSEPIEGSTITAETVLLQTGGAGVPVSLVLSQDRRRLTIRPQSPLIGKTTYALTLTSGVKDLSGAGLVLFAPASFTTLDPTKPPQPPPGQIIAELPDADGLILVTGAAGTAEAGSPVTATNIRTQETFTVLASTDGSFRLRISGLVGDDITLTLRDAAGRETTIALSQLEGPDGSTAIGSRGGKIRGAGGRVGTILPRALVQAGVFRLQEAAAPAAVMLTAPFSYLDRFTLAADGGEFNTLAALTLTESQGRIASAIAAGAPFEVSGELTIPADFLVNSSLRFSAVAQDAAGTRRTAPATTVVVAANPDSSSIETAQTAEFPTLFVNAPRQATPNQVIVVGAVAPAARIDLSVAAPVAVTATTYLLTRLVDVAGQPRLSLIDSLERATGETGDVLRTSGRTLPGMTAAGNYAIVLSTEPLSFVTGQLVGAPGTVSADGLPFVFETTGPNGRFRVPVRADQPFTLQFFNADGSVRGTSTGQAPAAGSVDVGDPLGIATGHLLVTAEPGQNSIVDINAPIVFRFSEPVDVRSLLTAVVVTDAAGARVFGRFATADAGKTVEFRPSRRWRFGTTYRLGVSTSALAVSGARLALPFGGQFTTFAPSVVGQALVGAAADVSVSSSLALVATDAGASVVDVTSPLAAQSLANIPVPGGIRAAALLTTPTLTTRTGQVLTGRFAVIASGDATSAARLQLFDVTNAAAPILLGSTQLTTAPGLQPPDGVPAAAGTPRQILISPDNRALVAVEDLGLVTVRIGQMVPDDSTNPGQAIAGRYPVGGLESITSVALVGDRVLLAGATGLTVLDAATLERRGGLSAGSSLRDVAALPSFAMDANGDGLIAQSDVFDLAVGAGGSDGTLQFFRVPPAGDPLLLSVVRFPGQTTSVAVDAPERLVYVGLGSGGLAIVDLDGPASVQPIDVDRNGTDDRLLGSVAIPGSAGQLALQLSRGLGYSASGTGGLTALQLLPSRAVFESVMRDPVRAMTGDEQPIGVTRTAFASDEALQVTIGAIASPRDQLALTIEETPQDGGLPLLTFGAGVTGTPVQTGGTTFTIYLAPENIQRRSRATLRVQTSTGQTLASLDVIIEPHATGGAALDGLRAAPGTVTLGPGNDTVSLGLAGIFDSGLILNLTRGETGSTYTSDLTDVAAVDPDGLVIAVAGGRARVMASNSGRLAFAEIVVQRPAQLVALEATSDRMTLRTAGEQRELGILGRFSDGTFQDATAIGGTAFRSSDPTIATVDAAGRVTAVLPGDVTLLAENGTLTAQVLLTNEFRTPASISAIHLQPLPSSLSADEGRAVATAVLTGTGSLDGLEILFVSNGVLTSSVVAASDLSGSATIAIGPLTTAGSLTISVSAVDPATGQTRADTQTITVGAATGDNEPNDDPASASPLGESLTANGSIDSTGDVRDTYRLSTSSDGTIDITITVTGAGSLALVVRGANGEELARFVLSAGTTVRSIQLPAGAASITVEGVSGSATYGLSFKFQQADPTITAVSPLSGPAGTLVTITGTGFSTAPDELMVLFNGVAGKVTSVSPTTVNVQVPVNAANGVLEIVSGARQVSGPPFTTGLAAEPADFFIPPQVAFIRGSPDSRGALVVNRLLVSFDPTLARAGVDAILQQVGGVVAGFDAEDNSYIVEFPNNTSFDVLHQRRRLLEAQPAVVLVLLDSLLEPDSSRRIDMREYSADYAAAHEQIRLFHAVNAVRRSRLETDAFPTVRVAVLDDGVQVVSGGDLDGAVFSEGPTPGSGDHGTPVAGVIGALNDNVKFSGALNSVKFPGEPPFAVHVFTVALETTNYFYRASIKAALKRIKARNRDANALNDVDVINMSFGGFSSGAEMERDRRFWKKLLKPLEPRTLVAASAGNEGFHTFVPGAFGHFPSAMAFAAPPGGQPLSNVLSVGATATPISASGVADERAKFSTPWRDTFPCAGINTLQTRTKESNCDPGLSLVAPGKDVPTVNKAGDARFFEGTSAASPLVAAIAALVQSVRPDFFVRIPPDRIAAILQVTADDISEVWTPVGPGGSLRLNALGAVRALLPPPPVPNVYVADTDADVVIALSADPITGVVGGSATRISLNINRPDFQMNATRPTSLAVSPAGDRLYVAATSEFDAFGVVVVNTDTLKAVHFITLYEGGCGAGQTPMQMETLRPGMAFSRDGRLLYLTNGDRLVVINTDTEEQVHTFARLPAPYNIKADTASPDLGCRLDAIRTLVTSGQLGLRGTTLGALELSPDGRILYLAMQAGRGTESQPGAVIPIDVNLYDDGEPVRPGLQPDLSKFLKPAFDAADVKSLQMPPDPPDAVAELTRAIKGDEPSDIAVSPDGQFVYLLNGGVQAYSGAIPDDQALRAGIVTALGGLIVGGAVAASGNLYAAAVGAAVGGAIMSSALVHDILPEMVRISKEVGVIVAAPGVIAAFDTKSNPAGEVRWFFTTSTAFAWVTGDDRLGFNADQRSFDQVFASRPFGMTMKPDGSRAIVSLFQTGNFGVVDESAQSFFKNVNSQFARAPAGVFQGFAGVTPAIRFDRFLWPENPLDERLLYPTAVEYAQNGRFAVGVHTGVSDGAVTVLDDEAITRDLAAHVGTPAPGFFRSYFAQVPLCKTLNTATFRCTDEVFTRLFDYDAGGGTATFKRPRGVAIDPFLVVEAPRFGDYVTIGSAVHVRWRSAAGSAVTRVVFEVEDLGTASAPLSPTSVGRPVTVTPNPLDSLSQSLKAGIVAIFDNNAALPQDGHRYRIKVRAVLGSGDTLSRTSIDVKFVDQ